MSSVAASQFITAYDATHKSLQERAASKRNKKPKFSPVEQSATKSPLTVESEQNQSWPITFVIEVNPSRTTKQTSVSATPSDQPGEHWKDNWE